MKFFSYSLIIAVSHLNATNEHPMAPHNDLYQFHYGSQLPLARSLTHSNPAHALSILQQSRDMQKEQDEEAEQLGAFFSISAGGKPDRLSINCRGPYSLGKQEHRLALLWSAKSALDKSAVQIQGKTQPLRDSKSHSHRLGTILKEKIFEALDCRKKPMARILQLFCDHRTDYLQHHAHDQLSRPENQAISYDEFKKLQLDDPFWNNKYLCLSKDPWAVDPTVRTGIHATVPLRSLYNYQMNSAGACLGESLTIISQSYALINVYV
ncbi:hypothetical protein MJO28_015196, partial [Puccinia striiformis f. sp. tritici]